MGKYLDQINSPSDLLRLSMPEMECLAAELREMIINTVAQTGGHLAPSLGTVELTLALERSFRLPHDKIVWDVGHQAYAHKIITGRRERFASLRQKDGITGFPRRAESPYDAFGVGHASTSVSAALGMAVARDTLGRGDHVVAVIGDGSFTGGEAWEAVNHAGHLGKNLIVVLNDNGMSIDESIGAVSEYLSRLRLMPEYNKAKKDLESLIKNIPHIGDTVLKTASMIKDGVKAALVPGGVFEELGFRYIGPMDGHDLPLLCQTFEEVRQLDGPVFVHVRTKKGRGYIPAEIDPERFHGTGPFDVLTGRSEKKAALPTYTGVFSAALCEIAAQRPDVVAITAAMPSGTGLKAFGEKYPERFFDVAIAEEHAVTLAAGMAAGGIKPVVAIYSTFLQRGYDQILHDVCLQNLPVVFCLDRAGLVGEDGPTHHGVFDLAYLRHMPGLTVMAPADEDELRHMLLTAIETDGPVAIRYPRGAGLGVDTTGEMKVLPFGQAAPWEMQDSEVFIMAVGNMVAPAQAAAEILTEQGIAAQTVNMRFVKPLDTAVVDAASASEKVRLLVTAEENVLAGGFGSAVAEYMADSGLLKPLLRFGIGDEFVPQGTQQQEREYCGLLPSQMAEQIKARLAGGKADG